jgi:hypothetical protein
LKRKNSAWRKLFNERTNAKEAKRKRTEKAAKCIIKFEKK